MSPGAIFDSNSWTELSALREELLDFIEDHAPEIVVEHGVGMGCEMYCGVDVAGEWWCWVDYRPQGGVPIRRGKRTNYHDVGSITPHTCRLLGIEFAPPVFALRLAGFAADEPRLDTLDAWGGAA